MKNNISVICRDCGTILEEDVVKYGQCDACFMIEDYQRFLDDQPTETVYYCSLAGTPCPNDIAHEASCVTGMAFDCPTHLNAKYRTDWRDEREDDGNDYNNPCFMCNKDMCHNCEYYTDTMVEDTDLPF